MNSPRPMHETCDMLINFEQDNPGMEAAEIAVVETAWEQQDLYPGASGYNIRIGINAEAIEEVSEMMAARLKKASQALAGTVMSPKRSNRDGTIYIVTQTLVSA